MVFINSSNITCIGIITVVIALFEFIYYFTPYIIEFSPLKTGLTDLFLVDHPKMFPSTKIVATSKKCLKAQYNNNSLTKLIKE